MFISEKVSEVVTSSASAETAESAAAGAGFAAVILIIVLLALYFLPGIIASARKHHNAVPIWLVNIFLGWSFIGWIAALIWAFTAKQQSTIVNVNHATPMTTPDRPNFQPLTAQTANDEIIQLKAMKEAGTITEAEFDEKRAKVLARVG